MRKKLLILFFVLCICGVTVASVYPYSYNANALTQSEYDKQKADLSAQIEEINKNVNTARSSINSLSNQKKTLADQVSQTNGEITNLQKLIGTTEQTIASLQIDIQKNEAKTESLKAQIAVMFRQIQNESLTSPLQVVLTSDNLGQALSRVYNLSQTQNKAIDLQKELERITAELTLQKNAQEEVKTQSITAANILRQKKSDLDVLLQQTQNEESKYQDLLAKQTDNLKKTQDFLATLPKPVIAPVNNGGGSSGGSSSQGGGGNQNCFFTRKDKLNVPSGYFSSPIHTGEGYLSDNYGCPVWSGRDRHDGVDIGVWATNPPVYAAAGGTVAYAATSETVWYGYYVIIRHNLPSGQTVFSLYAHLRDRPLVAAGTTVAKGQQVGFAGNTGNSFGNHLHFMLVSDDYLSNGIPYCSESISKCYDPMEYIKF